MNSLLTAQRSNVAVYTVDPCGLEADCGVQERIAAESANTRGGDGRVRRDQHESRQRPESIGCFQRTVPTTWLAITRRLRPNDRKHHRMTVRTRVRGCRDPCTGRLRFTGKAAKALAATPLEVLTRSAIQTRGLTMRVVAIPAPLSTEPSAAVIVGIELPTAVATRAGRIEFAVVAIDDEGKTRARVRFTTNFAASEKTTSSWTRTGSRIDLSPGSTSFGSPPSAPTNHKAACSWRSWCRSSTPNSVWEGCPWALPAQSPSPARSASRCAAVDTPGDQRARSWHRSRGTASDQSLVEGGVKPLTITATLVRADGTTQPLDSIQAAARDYASAAGKVYRVALPQALTAGSYRVIVESTLGRTTVPRETAFSVLSRE